MGSAVSNGTTSVGSRAHEAGMNLSTFTWAGWVKRTGAGESDFRLFNKASGTAIGSPNITGQGGALTRLRGRHSAGGGGGFDLSITNDGALPASSWVCLFVVWGLGGTPNIRIFQYDGVDSVDELTYSSTSNSGAALSFNTADLTIFNTTDGTQCYAGKAAHWVWTADVWDTTTMLAFATGAIPSGLTDHYWPLQADGVDAGEVGGFNLTLSNVTFDGADSPPVTYGGGGSDLSDTITDTAEAADTVAATLTVVRTLTDVATATDLGDEYALDTADTIADAATGSDSATAVAALARSLTDEGTGSDTLSTGVNVARTITDGAAATDSVTADASAGQILTDVAEASDTVTAQVTVARALADSSTATDSVTAELVAPGSEVAIHTGPADGPARYLETITGPELARDVTGPLPSRAMTGPELVTVAVAGPARTAGSEPAGPGTARDITGPDTARTLTGPGI